MTVSREQSVDHKLTNALVLFLCSLGSSLESVIGDDVFLVIFHALIILNQDRERKGYLGKLSFLSPLLMGVYANCAPPALWAFLDKEGRANQDCKEKIRGEIIPHHLDNVRH